MYATTMPGVVSFRDLSMRDNLIDFPTSPDWRDMYWETGQSSYHSPDYRPRIERIQELDRILFRLNERSDKVQ